MNPARSLAPAVLSGVMANLWLYWTATFVGTSAVALLLRKNFMANRKERLDRYWIMLSSVLIVDAIRKIVKIAILLKRVQTAHGKNVVGLICISYEITPISERG